MAKLLDREQLNEGRLSAKVFRTVYKWSQEAQGQTLNNNSLVVEMTGEAITGEEVPGSLKQLDGEKATGSDGVQLAKVYPLA